MVNFPAETEEGKVVYIVSKSGGDYESLTDADGNVYTKGPSNKLVLVKSAPAAGGETASEPEVEEQETFDPAPFSTDDDPLGNPLTEGEQAATAEGVASGDPVPADAAPIESDEWV